MNVNDGTPSSPSLPKTMWPSWPIFSAMSRLGISPTFERSAPAARKYGLPVIATAWISPAAARACSSSSRSPSSSIVTGPSVDGRVWSRSLSSVMSASTRPDGRRMSRTYECVTTSSSANAAASSEKSIFE